LNFAKEALNIPWDCPFKGVVQRSPKYPMRLSL
jgi:hypothetical protein